LGDLLAIIHIRKKSTYPCDQSLSQARRYSPLLKDYQEQSVAA
jgi:hypothetical protein